MSSVHQIRVGAEFQRGGRTVDPLPSDVLVGAASDYAAGSAVVLLWELIEPHLPPEAFGPAHMIALWR
jgi:hypothetical protein